MTQNEKKEQKQKTAYIKEQGLFSNPLGMREITWGTSDISFTLFRIEEKEDRAFVESDRRQCETVPRSARHHANG